MSTPHVVVVMGVSGTGKSTVGRLLADEFAVPYAEADEFHPPANIAKMSSGTPLDDSDREPWLDAIGAWVASRAGLGGVVSCSALKRAYRDRLRAAATGLFFVHLTGDRTLIAERLEQRRDHFMPGALLDSQFAALEPLQADEYGTAVPVIAAPEAITAQAAAAVTGRFRPDPDTEGPDTEGPDTEGPDTEGPDTEGLENSMECSHGSN